jgi:hypothetical protein
MPYGKKIHNIPLISVILFLLSIFLFSNCSKDSTDSSNVAFAPGTYTGTYKTTEHWHTNHEVIKCDTMRFSFIAPDTFRMRYADKDSDNVFCQTNGKYVFGNDSLKITISYIYPDICVSGEEPKGQYYYYVNKDLIVFQTPDTAFNRQIILWTN